MYEYLFQFNGINLDFATYVSEAIDTNVII